MNTLKYLLVGLVAWPVAGMADTLSGSLNITSPLHIHIKQETNCREADSRPGCLGPFEFDLAPGVYSSQAVVGTGSLYLTIRGHGQYAELDMSPANKSIPSNGSFQLSASEIEQDWGLNGTIQTTESDSAELSGWERCTYNRQEWVCGPRGCGWVYVTVYGQRWVSFHDHSVNRGLQMDAVESHPVAHFTGNAAYIRRVYTQAGYCQ